MAYSQGTSSIKPNSTVNFPGGGIKAISTVTPEQKQAIDAILKGGISGIGGGGGTTPFTGIAVDSRGPGQFIDTRTETGGTTPVGGGSTDQTPFAETILDPTATAKYVKSAVATPLLREYDKSILPRLRDTFASAGALSSSRRGLAEAQQLGNIQSLMAKALGEANLSNLQQRAQLGTQTQLAREQLAQQGQQFESRLPLDWGQLLAQLSGQSQVALQPYSTATPNVAGPTGVSDFLNKPFAGTMAAGGTSSPTPVSTSTPVQNVGSGLPIQPTDRTLSTPYQFSPSRTLSLPGGSIARDVFSPFSTKSTTSTPGYI